MGRAQQSAVPLTHRSRKLITMLLLNSGDFDASLPHCLLGFMRCPPEELVEILETVNPANKAGRVTLITRMSSKYLDEHLPKLILAVQKAGLNVRLWFHV